MKRDIQREMGRNPRILAALAALLLTLAFAVGALALGEEQALQEVQTAIADLQGSLTGWKQLMVARAVPGTPESDGKNVTLVVQVPSMLAQPGNADDLSADAAAWLREALRPLTDAAPDTEIKLQATVKEKDGEVTLTWKSTPSKAIRNRLDTLETSAVKAMGGKTMLSAWNQLLLPDVAEMPRKKPDTVPEMAVPAACAEQAAPVLGWGAAETAERLAPFFLLSEITKVSVTDGPQAAKVTLEQKDWNGAMTTAQENARLALDGITGVPDMERAAMEALYLDELRSAAMNLYYKKKVTEEKKTLDLLALAENGIAADAVWAESLKDYGAAYDAQIAELAAYAGTLAYYPRVEQIDSQVLLGGEEISGSSISFSLQNEPVENAYLAVFQGKLEVLRLYIHAGDRISAVLPAGSYTVYVTMGPEWFGPNVIFGRDAYYGVFDLEIAGSMRYALNLADREDGNVPAEDITEEDFRAKVPVLLPEAE